MTTRQLAIAAGLVAIVIGGLVVLLVTGGTGPGEEAKDPSGDVEIEEGPKAPSQTDLADVEKARVYLHASQIVFEAQMAAPIPRSLKGETMEWRWEIFEGGDETWLVSAHISVGEPVAALTAQQSNYASSTIDDKLPGGIDHQGNTIFVRLDQPGLKRFPKEFTWRLTTTLDGDRSDPSSGVATDTAPATGLGEYPPPDQ